MDVRGELDERYSDPAATAITWPVVTDLLGNMELVWLTSVRPDGRPHATPVVAAWHHDTVYFTTARREQKARNMSTNPHVLVTVGANGWNHGIDVIIEGRAHLVDDLSEAREATSAFATKWDGRWTWDVRRTDAGVRLVPTPDAEDADIVMYAVSPETAYAHAKDPYSQTTFSFDDGPART